jgi:hypothetical protein
MRESNSCTNNVGSALGTTNNPVIILPKFEKCVTYQRGVHDALEPEILSQMTLSSNE